MDESKPKKLGSPDWILVGAMVALTAVGLLMVYSSTSDWGYRNFQDQAHYFKRQLLWLAIGTVATFFVAWFDYRHWTKLSIVIMAGTVLMLVILVVFGIGRQLFGRSVSPVELAKLAVVIYIGHWLSSKGELLRKLPYGLLPFTIMVGLIAGLVMAQPDISEAVVIVLVALAMFFLAGARLQQFAIGILGGMGAFALVVSQLDTALERLAPFLECWKQPLSCPNDHLRQGLVALGSGGLFGMGPGNGRMKYLWLPAPHTDSIFAVVGEELGFLGGMAVIALFALVAYRGFRLARLAPDSFGSLLAVGITCWIALQALINLLVVTGTTPFTGIALPFISLGGSSLVTCMIGIGIMLSISRAVGTTDQATS
jgi:cell division protein FtsW